MTAIETQPDQTLQLKCTQCGKKTRITVASAEIKKRLESSSNDSIDLVHWLAAVESLGWRLTCIINTYNLLPQIGVKCTDCVSADKQAELQKERLKKESLERAAQVQAAREMLGG